MPRRKTSATGIRHHLQELAMTYEMPAVIEEAILAQVTGTGGPTGQDE
jgi:hypothetical protein